MSEADSVMEHLVLANTNLPASVLMTLAFDQLPDVRVNLACNYHTPAQVLEILARDENETVRAYVPMHRNLQAETLYELTQDEDSDVRREAMKTIMSRLDIPGHIRTAVAISA
jgi:hypothetical protein